MDKNSFYRSELRVLFIKYNVAQNEGLINELAEIVGVKDRAAQGANEAVNNFFARFNVEDHEEITYEDLHELQKNVYGIVWQSSLEK